MQPNESGDPLRPPEPEQGADAEATRSSAPMPLAQPAPAERAGATPGETLAAPAARTRSSGIVVASGVILLVLAVLAFLWAILFGIYGAMIGSIRSMIENNPGAFGSPADVGFAVDMMRPVIYGFAFLAVLIGAAHAAAGIGVLARKGWARITAFVLAGLGLLGNVIGLISVVANLGIARTSFQNGLAVDPRPGLIVGAVIFLVFGGAYAFVVLALARRGLEFASR